MAAEVRRHGVALVGLGRSGRFHMTSLANLTHATSLEWVIDSDEGLAQRVAAEKRCKWSTNLDKALADPKVDFVVIASTTDTHFPYIMQSLNANKAVLTEKPISHDVKEVQTACDLAMEKDLLFVCGYQRRCDNNFRVLKQLLDDGSIGQLKILKCCSRDNPVPPMAYLRTSGGIFHDMLVHDFDMQAWLTGEHVPESVLSVGHCYNQEIKDMNDIDTVAVMFKYENGMISMIDTSRDAAYGYDQRIEVFGSKGMLTAKNEMTSSVELATANGHLMPPAEFSFPERYKDAYSAEMSDFVALVTAGADSDKVKKEKEAMLRYPSLVRTVMAAELSWKLGRQVFLSEDLDALQRQVEASTLKTSQNTL
jgi:myo-inositol 2-dehydrogenase/D-chiro-inositol 1-dehydrogenase